MQLILRWIARLWWFLDQLSLLRVSNSLVNASNVVSSAITLLRVRRSIAVWA